MASGANLTVWLYLSGQQPFDANALLGDFSWLPVPLETDLAATHLAHEHYDRTSADADRNSAFPLERLRELVSVGKIGALTATHYSFSSYLPDWAEVMDRFAPALADRVAEQHPDAVLLVPV